MADTVRFGRITNPADVLTHTVAIKSDWQGAWVTVGNLHCDEAVWAAAPSTSTARLYWRYGWGKSYSGVSFEQIARQSGVLRYYVKITFSLPLDSSTRTWYGVLEIDADMLDGTYLTSSAIPTGRQHLYCFGLEHLLDQKIITTSWWMRDDDAADDHLAEYQIERGLTFNDRGIGNMSNRWASGKGKSFVFGDQLNDTVREWSTLNIVRYLVTYQAPEDAAGNVQLRFRLGSSALRELPDSDRPELPAHGRRLRALLNALMSRQRGWSWCLSVTDSTPQTADIEVFTFTPSKIDLPSGESIPANLNQKLLVFDGDPTAEATLKESTLEAVDQVIVTGRRRRNCFSCGYLDSNLEDDWSAALETEYREAASTAMDYPAASEVDERQRRNAEARAADHLRPVFSRFKLVDDWNGKVGDGEGGVAADDMKPAAPSDDNLDEIFPLYPPEIYFAPTLPLLQHHEYEDDKIASDDVTTTLTLREYEELPPLVFTKLPEDSLVYVHVEHVGQTADLDKSRTDTTNRRWSATVKVPPHSREVELRVRGAEQHVLANNHWTPIDASDEDIAKFDFADFVFTVAIEDDRFCEGRWPVVAPKGPDALRILHIDAGPTYKLDYVAPNTVVGIDTTTGALKRTNDGGFIHNDRFKLQDIARAAYAWYSQTRAALEYQTSQITSSLSLGDLVTGIGDPAVAGGHQRTVNTVITQIRLAVPRGAGKSPGAPRIEYRTQWAELDLVR